MPHQIKAMITNYFLRIYSKECSRNRSTRGWSPYREAMLQTTMLISFPMVAVASTAVLIVMKSNEHVKASLLAVGPIVIVVTTALILFSANSFAKWLCRGLADDPELVSRFDTPRDRLRSHVVFFVVLIASLATPFLCAAVLYAS
jgi:hypothetical protein